MRQKRHGDAKKLTYKVVGQTKHPLYSTYAGMLQRCYYTRGKAYANYGGRGITVCDRWRGIDGFMNFVKDMGNKPSPGHTLDRRDTDGNYESSNCRWATRDVQVQNRRLFSNNTTGLLGVSFNPKNNKWYAQIRIEGHKTHLGHFDTPDLAANAYATARRDSAILA